MAAVSLSVRSLLADLDTAAALARLWMSSARTRETTATASLACTTASSPIDALAVWLLSMYEIAPPRRNDFWVLPGTDGGVRAASFSLPMNQS